MGAIRTVYRDGRPAEARDGRSVGAFTWVDLGGPVAPDLAAVATELGLPDAAVELLRHGSRQAALEVLGDLLLVAVRSAHWLEDQQVVATGEVRLVVGPGWVVSVDGGMGELAQVRQDAEGDPVLLRHGPGAVLLTVVDRACRSYGPVLHGLGEAIEDVEEVVFSPGRATPTERIYNLFRQVLALQRASAPLAEAVERLAGEPLAPLDGHLRERFRGVRAHLRHVVTSVDALAALLTNVLQANLTQVSVRQNDDMRRISAWAAIIAVPTLVAGVYGMNF